MIKFKDVLRITNNFNDDKYINFFYVNDEFRKKYSSFNDVSLILLFPIFVDEYRIKTLLEEKNYRDFKILTIAQLRELRRASGHGDFADYLRYVYDEYYFMDSEEKWNYYEFWKAWSDKNDSETRTVYNSTTDTTFKSVKRKRKRMMLFLCV